MNIRALRDEVIVERIIDEESESGLYIPESAKKCNKAKVLSVGRRVTRNGKSVEPEVSIGDIVVFPQGTGILMETGEDQKPLMLKYQDILGILS